MRSKRRAAQREIHRRLAVPEAPEYVADAVGVSLSTIYRHRAGRCRCSDDGVGTDTEPEDPILAELEDMGLLSRLRAAEAEIAALTQAGLGQPLFDGAITP